MPPRICTSALVLLTLAAASCGRSGAPAGIDAAASTVVEALASPPLALVYRGPAGCDGCAEPVARLLESSRLHFEVTYVGPRDAPLDDDLLARAAVYAQPGGGNSVEQAFAYVAADAPRIRSFVQNGGRYLGFCMGGYFAGTAPGFELLPGDSGGFITSPGASVTTDADTTVEVVWRGARHLLYFQDGPYFTIDPRARGAAATLVLATYASNGEIAALVAPFGRGKVGVVGPHPEAPQGWFDDYGLTDPEQGHGVDLGHDLVETTMAP